MRNSNVAENKKIYKVELPYPPVKVDGPNREYAEYMLENLAGAVSEMSDVAAYLYQSLILEPKYQEVIDILNGINKTEMYHVQIIGELAKQLGADPRLWEQKGNRKRYWTPGYIQYPTKLEDILRYDIQREQEAINQYAKQTRIITDRSVVNNLKRIILDEQLHLEILMELYKKYFPPMPK